MLTYASVPVLPYHRHKLAACVIFSLILVAFARWLWMQETVTVSHEKQVNSNGTTEDLLHPRTPHFHLLPSEIPVDIEALLELPLIDETQGLTAVFPVSSGSLLQFPDLIKPLLQAQVLAQIIIPYSQDASAQLSSMMHQIVAQSGLSVYRQPELSLIPSFSAHNSLEQALEMVTTEYVLVLNDSGLQDIQDETIRTLLLEPRAFPYLIGPHGFPQGGGNSTNHCGPQLASHLNPPYVGPRHLLDGLTRSIFLQQPLGIPIMQLSGPPGIVISQNTCCTTEEPNAPDLTADFADITSDEFPLTALFAVVLSGAHELHSLSPMLCGLHTRRRHLRILLTTHWRDLSSGDYTEIDLETSTAIFRETCYLQFDTFGDELSSAASWFSTLPRLPDVVIATSQDWIRSGSFSDTIAGAYRPGVPLILLSPEDLPYCAWMASLSLEEWRNWRSPLIDLSLITQNRPRSLERLLKSLTEARFFGDKVTLRINIEQDADDETLDIVSSPLRFWKHGTVVVHRRVVQGGLLPAVVESWYPASNDSYGILLEDDIQVSPMFYAWAKLAILRYRYGHTPSQTSKLFGISLYQQSHNELVPGERIPFDAYTMFSGSPYLSQIPCSWGAVFFPEHWREFYDYLSVRLSEHYKWLSLDRIIVPGVRSNKWTRSWKKYFIELAYLRGYVMLYPSFSNLVSLSTNHLEPGVHVKSRSKRNQELFILPLMTLEQNEGDQKTGIMQSPDSTLPHFGTLSVLNLTGARETMEGLAVVGEARWRELCGYHENWMELSPWKGLPLR